MSQKLLEKKDAAVLSLGLQKFYGPHLFFPNEEKTKDIVISHLRGNLVLDAGCGNGWLSLCTWEEGVKTVALDVAQIEIRKSVFIFKKRKTNIPLTRASLEALPFNNSLFDSIICISVLEHISDVRKAIREMSRVLKEEGRLILLIPNKLTFGLFYDKLVYKFIPRSMLLSRAHKAMFSLSDNEISELHSKEEPIWHCQQFTLSNLANLLSTGGFSTVRIIKSRFFSPYLRSLCALFGICPVKAFERLDNKIVNHIPLNLASEWIIICDKT